MSKEFAYWFQNIVMWCENCCQFHCFPLPHHHRGVCYVTCTWEVDWNCVMSLMRIFVNLSCMKNGAWPLYNHQKKKYCMKLNVWFPHKSSNCFYSGSRHNLNIVPAMRAEQTVKFQKVFRDLVCERGCCLFVLSTTQCLQAYHFWDPLPPK